MDTEYRAILDAHETRLKKQEYLELRKLIEANDVEIINLTAPSGRKYELEIQACWDDEPKGHIRIVIHIHDGDGYSVFRPKST